MKTVNVMVIENEDDLTKALARIEELWNAPEDSIEAAELDVLTLLVEAYENTHHPVPPPTPIGAVRFEMNQRKLRNKDLEPYIGPASRVSEFLAGKIKLTVPMIRRLHEGLGIPLASLVADDGYGLRRNATLRPILVSEPGRMSAEPSDR